MLKQYKKQTQTRHTRLTNVNSDSNTQLCSIQIENPNEPLYRLDETYPLMNSYVRDSGHGSFANDPDERHSKYSHSILLLPEESAFEDMSENETDLCEKLSCLQNKKNKSQEDLISLKISNSMKNIQSKGRSPQPKIIQCDNSIRKQCKCNRGNTKLLITQKNTIKENHPISNRNFDDTCLITDPIEGLHKKRDRKYGVHDREISIPLLKHASTKNEELETDISTQKFRHYHFDNNQEYIVNSENIYPLLRTHEKCSKCTASKEENFTLKSHETECFPHGRYNQQENRNYHKDLRAPLFQNSNIPIAKRVLEDDQFYDLRQKFCGTENIINASNPMTDEERFSRLITNNKEIYQPNEKSCAIRDENYIEENTKYPRIRYAAYFTEESGNENQTSNASSPCDSSGKEEIMCNYWKSLKTKTTNQKRNKGFQVEISSVSSNDSELLLQMNTDVTKVVSKRKSHEANQSKRAQGTIVKKNAESSTRNQSTQINRNKKQHIPLESSLTEIVEHYSNAQLPAAQMSDDKRHTENGTYKNCKCFLASGDYSEDRIDAIKPRAIHSRPRLKQSESHYPCDEHLLSSCTQINESTENIQYYVNGSLTPNFRKKWENLNNRYNADYDLQNKHNYVCHPTMPMNHHENNEYLNTYNDIKRKQMQRMYLEQENKPLSNPFVQHNKYKHQKPPAEKNICYNSEQLMKSQFPSFREPLNKMSVTTHQYVQNKSSMNDPKIPTNFWSDENTVSYENKLCVRNRDIQNEDDSIQLLSHKTNNRQKMHDATETDVKKIQTSAVTLIPPNHAKEYSKQISKDIPKKSKSQIKIDVEQDVEKSNAKQIQAKENVLKQIKRMYAHMDQNVHETNKSVTTQIKKVLKSKGMWHSEK